MPGKVAVAAICDNQFFLMKLTQGVHYRSLSSDLSVQKTREVLGALERPEILRVLERWPIERILIERSSEKTISAEYHSLRRVISVNSARKLGVHFGAAFRPGETRNMSIATWDKIDSMRRSLLQEIAHHVEHCVPGVKDCVRRAFADPTRRSITRYGSRRADEYFAETFIAAIVEPTALATHDSVGSTMMEQALRLIRNLDETA